MGTALFTKYDFCAIARQPARGTIGTNFRRYRKTGGSRSTAKDIQRQAYLDGNRWAGHFAYVNTLGGGGTLTLQGSADTVADFIAWVGFNVVTTGPDVNGVYTHTLTPSQSGSPFLTIDSGLGQAPVQELKRDMDCKIASGTVVGSAGSKVVTVSLTYISLRPGIVLDNETPGPVAEEPMLYTDGDGSFDLGSMPADFAGSVTGWEMSFNAGEEVYYTDSVRPRGTTPGESTLEFNFTAVAEDVSLAALNSHVYGTPNPAPGAEPTDDIFYDSIAFNLTRGTGAGLRQIAVTIPRHEISVTDSPDGSTDGGKTDIGFAGQVQPPTSGPMMTVVIRDAVAAH